MANLTGFSPDAARNQINLFYNTVCDLAREFSNNGSYPFMWGLVTAWCSPKAKEFSLKHFSKIAGIDTNVKNMGRNIAINAKQAYNYIAESNGGAKLPEDFFQNGTQASTDKIDWFGTLDEVSENGVVGMNHQNVRLLVNLFKNAVNKLITGLNDLPLDIAFYDPDGEMKAAYRQQITDMVSIITEKTNALYADIDDALETEINTILIAKEEAASTMAG
jgi:hypothetical protein